MCCIHDRSLAVHGTTQHTHHTAQTSQMPIGCAIYGYEFTREFIYRGLQFIPRHESAVDSHRGARDLTRYNLTGVVLLDSYDDHQMFCLEAVLSFVEHLDVLISDPTELPVGDYFSGFPVVARMAKRHKGGEEVLHRDVFFPSVRPDFIRLAMDQLADSSFCEATGWDTLFFKTTAWFCQRSPYLEVSYFLLFSGLETYVRRTLGDEKSKDVAGLIARRLRQMGFNIYSYEQSDLARSADSYARLRNALFHNSSLHATRKCDGGSVTKYSLRDYYGHFRILVSLVVLKGIGFEHPSIQWDSWINMQ